MQDACKLTSSRRYLAAAIIQNSQGEVGEERYFLFFPLEDCARICMSFMKDTTLTIMGRELCEYESLHGD